MIKLGLSIDEHGIEEEDNIPALEKNEERATETTKSKMEEVDWVIVYV